MSWALLAALIFAEPPLRTPPVLLGDPPRAEAAAGRRDMLDVVRLQLTLDEQGGPTEVVVFTSTTDDPAVLEAALAVGRTLRFQPATDGGEPIAARIRVQVEVGSSPAWAGRDRRPLEAPPPPPVAGDGEVLGRVLERGTRRPLPGLPVTLPELGRIETTDAAGRFRFEGLPKRPLRLEIPALDHEAVAEEITAGGEERVFRLERAPNARYESVVEAPTSDASAIRIPVSGAREVPGSSGDPVKVVEVLPGVARPAAAGPGAGQLSIRGSAPEDTRFYIDGMPVYQVFHFGGSTRSCKTSGSATSTTGRAASPSSTARRRVVSSGSGLRRFRTTASTATSISTSTTRQRSSPVPSVRTGPSAAPYGGVGSTSSCRPWRATPSTSWRRRVTTIIRPAPTTGRTPMWPFDSRCSGRTTRSPC